MISYEADQDAHSLIADIVGHPIGKPTRVELEYMSPGMTSEEFQNKLNELLANDVIESTESEGGHVFYTLSPSAVVQYIQSGGFPRDAWRRQYESVEKPPHIQELEELDRPGRRG